MQRHPRAKPTTPTPTRTACILLGLLDSELPQQPHLLRVRVHVLRKEQQLRGLFELLLSRHPLRGASGIPHALELSCSDAGCLAFSFALAAASVTTTAGILLGLLESKLHGQPHLL